MSRAVARHLRADYEQIRSYLDPFDLGNEIAALRTLLIEVRENIEDAAADKVVAYGELVQNTLIKEFLSLDPPLEEENALEMAEIATKAALRAYNAFWPKIARVTARDALEIAKTVEIISKVSEKYKKMIDGVSLDVVYDDRMAELLSKFVVNVVMKFIPVSSRKALAAACMDFIPNMKAELGPVEAEVLEDALEFDDEEAA